MTWAAREIWSMREGRRWAEPPQPTAQRRSAATKNQPGAWPTGLRLLLPSAGLPTPLEAGSTPTSLQAEPAEKKEISWEHGAGRLLAAREMEPERSCSAGGPGAAPAQLGADLPSCPAAAPRLLGVPVGGAGKGDAGPASPLPEGNLHPPGTGRFPEALSALLHVPMPCKHRLSRLGTLQQPRAQVSSAAGRGQGNADVLILFFN